jgi:17beta-estradiol 17-dehydrogenase / very-long-chain 3-oxoacyl-CoA reductase
MSDVLLKIAAGTGAVVLSYLTISFLRLFISTKKYPFKPQKDSYAVVTGASDGIGREFALQLAKKGYNLIILARSEDKLKVVQSSIKETGRDCIVIPFDFSTTLEQKFEDLKKKLDSYQVEVLVNNVGVSHEMPIAFLEEDLVIAERIMQVNCHSMMRMTRIVGSQMASNRKGLILNIGSFSGKVPCGLLAVYAASKAWVSSWTQGLAMELKEKKVHVEHINTYFVQTNMSKIRKSSLMVPTPNAFVKSVLANCGGAISSTPYWSHRILDWITDFIPKGLLIDQSYKLHIDIRKRALRKREREQKAQ